jgi:hypothetical protein
MQVSIYESRSSRGDRFIAAEDVVCGIGGGIERDREGEEGRNGRIGRLSYYQFILHKKRDNGYYCTCTVNTDPHSPVGCSIAPICQ